VCWGKLIGVVRRPPACQAVSTKYVNTIFSKVEAEVRVILYTTPGGFFQYDAWPDPSGSQVFLVSLWRLDPIIPVFLPHGREPRDG